MKNFLLQTASDLTGEGLSVPDVAASGRQKLKIQEGHEFYHLQEGHYEKSGTGHPTGHLQEWADHPNSKTKTKRKNQNEMQERNELKRKKEKNEMQEGHEFDHLQEGHYEKSGTGHPNGHLQEWADHPNSKTKSSQNVNQYYSDDYEEYITLHEDILLTLNTRHDPTFHMQEHIEQPVLQETQTQNQPQGNSSYDSEEYIDKCPYTMTLPKKQVQHEIDLSSIKEKLNSNFEYELAPISNICNSDIVKVITGHFAQSDQRFHIDSRGKQCTCNAVVFLCHCNAGFEINSHSIDAILDEGDRLYQQLVDLLKQSRNEDVNYLTFPEIELLSPLSVFQNQFTITLVDNSFNGSLQMETDRTAGIYSLEDALNHVFTNYTQSLVMIGTYAMALVKTNTGQFALFDSHTHGLDGSFHDVNGTAAYIVFPRLQEIVSFLRKNFRLRDQFEFQPINIKLQCKVTKQKQSEIICSPKHKKISESVISKVNREAAQTTETPNLTEKHSTKNMSSFQTENETSAPTTTNISEILQNYFTYQQEKEKQKKMSQPNLPCEKTSKANRNRMRHKRMHSYYRENEKLKDLSYKRKKRQEEKFREQERISKSLRRNNKKLRHTENIHRKARRTLAKVAERTKIIERKSKQKLRTDDKFRIKENIHRKTRRMLPQFAERTKIIDQKSKQKLRRDDKFRIQENIHRKTRRKLPEVGERTKIADRKSKQKLRRDDKFRIQENIHRKTRRKLPEVGERTKIADRKSKQKNRAEDEFRIQENIHRKTRRMLPQVGERTKIIERMSKRKLRSDDKFRTHENMHKKTRRTLPQAAERIKKIECKSKQKLRTEKKFRNEENIHRKARRTLPGVGERIKIAELKSKKNSKKKKKKAQENLTDFSNPKRKDLMECITKFHEIISVGPVYTCCVCYQTWFKHSVSLMSEHQVQIVQTILDEKIALHEGKTERWICRTCKTSINKCKVPKLSVANKCGFPESRPELNLHPLEERLIALRIPFMQIKELPRGGQFCLKGNVVNVPVKVNTTVFSLPRNLAQTQTVPVKLKRKLCYNKCEAVENVRPTKVIKALEWLVQNSMLYKEIEIDKNQLLTITAENSDSSKKNATDSSDDEEQSEPNLDDDGFSEVSENEQLGNMDTLMYECEYENEEYIFAPGEGQKPLGIFKDPNAEYLSFPTIFCGGTRPDNNERKVPVHYSDICKYELRCKDRRVAKSVPNIFFKLKKLQLSQISGKVNLVMRKCQTKGNKIMVKDVLDQEKLDHLVRLDEGYYIFRSIRNSPAYFESRKKDVFAMIRQLGLPTWFMSLSSADSKWIDLLQILGKLVDQKMYTKEDIQNMEWGEKTRLVQSDPVTCSRYFDNRVHEFMNHVLKSNHHPLGKITDHFIRVEFQHRGSPHVHMLLWIDNAPRYGENEDTDIIDFIDNHVSCSSSVSQENEEYLQYQKHKHSKTCRKKGKPVCRFGHPIPPMRKTSILLPLEREENEMYEEKFKIIKSKLDEIDTTDSMDYDDFLKKILKMNEEEYIRAIRSSINGPKIFLKRGISEVRINAYIGSMLHGWGANHDLQFVLDAYACAVYIVSYVSKTQRGMSALMDRACKEAKAGNKDLKQQVRHIGNAFLNSVEVSSQEACYLLLQMPLTSASRDVVFINTSHPDDRTFLLKNQESLEKLSKHSTDIQASNVIKRYSQRPKVLEKWCLADYVSLLTIEYPKEKESEEVNDDHIELESETEQTEMDGDTGFKKIEMKSGMVIKKRRNPHVIRYVRFNSETDPENYYRERLLLFLPWRKELVDLKGPYQTYKDAYLAVKRAIDNTAQNYEQNVDIIDQAMQDAQCDDYEDFYSELAPETEQTERDDEAEGNLESDTYSFYKPSTEEHSQCDIGVDLGFLSSTVEIEHHAIRLPECEYRQLIQQLNMKQLEIYTHIIQWIKTDSNPSMNIFLTGGAGVGKSVVIRALYQTLHRYLCGTEGENPEEIRILLCAFTGSAAYNINGITVHKAFGLSANQNVDKPLSADNLNTFRMKYRKLSVVIIDEISLVSNQVFKVINSRLQQIKGNSKLFGGVHVIAVGDLFQLKPVMGSWIFQDLSGGYGPLAPNLWQENFKIFQLTEIIRQKDDKKFAEILNRLRLGDQNKDDIEVLKTCIIQQNDPKYNALGQHFFRYCADVQNHNQTIYENTNTEKMIVLAQDVIAGDTTKVVSDKLKDQLKNAKPHETVNLEKKLNLAVSLRYHVTININVEDGLTNGTDCTLKKCNFLIRIVKFLVFYGLPLIRR